MSLLKCPSCGAMTEVKNPGINLLSCQYCHTILYRDAQDILLAGKQAIVPDNDSRLWLGATGTIRNIPFQVIGRLRFSFSLGHWDEWYIRYGNKYAWLGEDARSLTLRVPATIPSNLDSNIFKLGQALNFGGTIYTVREVDFAKCMAFEGELPFAVLPGESMNYYDAATADGRQFAILSINQRGQKRLTSGLTISQEELRLDGQQDLKGQYDQAREAKALSCAHCGAALPKPNISGAVTIVCPSCQGANNIANGSKAQKIFSVSHWDPTDYRQHLIFDLGAVFTFYSIKYTVCGRIVSFDEEDTPACQYLLYNSRHGYKYLEYEEGQFLLLEKTQEAPNGMSTLTPSTLGQLFSCKVGNRSYKIYYRGSSTVKYVDGAFPWQTTIGETLSYTDCYDGRNYYGWESSSQELEFYKGEKLTRKQITVACEPKYHKDLKHNLQLPQLGSGIKILFYLILILPCFAEMIIGTYREHNPVTADNIWKQEEIITQSNDKFRNSYLPAWEAMSKASFIPSDKFNAWEPEVNQDINFFDNAQATLDNITERVNAATMADEIKQIENELKTINKESNQRLARLEKTIGAADKKWQLWSNILKIQQDTKRPQFTNDITLAATYQPGRKNSWIEQENNIKLAQGQWQNSLEKYLNSQPAENVDLTNVDNELSKAADLVKNYNRYEELFTTLNDELQAINSASETILVDLVIDERHGMKFHGFFREITVRQIDFEKVKITIRNFNRELTNQEYDQLDSYMGMAIAGKELGQPADKKQNLPRVAGNYLLPIAPKSSNLLGHWQDNNFVFDDRYSNLAVIWNNCLQPDKQYFTAISQDGQNDYLEKSVTYLGSVGSWTLFCYSTNKYYQNNRYISSQYIKSGRTYSRVPLVGKTYRHHSSSGSRSHGGK